MFHFKFSAFNRALERGPWLVPQPAQLTPREAVSELFRSLQREQKELASSLPETGQATDLSTDTGFLFETTKAPLIFIVRGGDQQIFCEVRCDQGNELISERDSHA